MPNYMLYGGTAFNPLSITGLQFWVDASDYTTLYQDSALTTRAINDGDVIGGWSDKSGNGRNALQTDGTKKPLLKLAIQNGRNIIRWDGVNDSLGFSSAVTSANRTTFCVFKVLNVNTLTILGSSANTQSGALYSQSGLVYDVAQFYYATGNDGSNGAFVLYSSTVNLLESQINQRKNGADLTMGPLVSNPGIGTLNQIGGRSTSQFGTGDICEILHYNSVLSGSDILLVEAYLKAKWGTP